MDGGMGGEIGGEKAEIKTWFVASRARDRGVQGRLVRAGPIHAMLEKSGGGMKLGQNPSIILARDRFNRFGVDLQVGRWVSIFVKCRILKFSADNVAIVRRQLVLWLGRVRFHLFAKSRLDFLKGNVRKRNQARPGEGKFRHLACAQKFWQRRGTIFGRHLLENATQTGRDPTGYKCVGIAPEIDPRRSLDRDFADQRRADGETGFAETLFADRVRSGVQETILSLAHRAERTELLSTFILNRLSFFGV